MKIGVSAYMSVEEQLLKECIMGNSSVVEILDKHREDCEVGRKAIRKPIEDTKDRFKSCYQNNSLYGYYYDVYELLKIVSNVTDNVSNMSVLEGIYLELKDNEQFFDELVYYGRNIEYFDLAIPLGARKLRVYSIIEYTLNNTKK